MEVKELRIGNYVKYNNNEIGTISGVQDFLINYGKVSINQRIDIFYHIENIKPIVITDIWLLEFGFIFDGITYSKNELMCSENFTFWYKHFGEQWRVSNNIMFIHQLQNLYFSLTNEELKINL